MGQQFKVLDAVTSDINCAFERYLREMAFLASPPLVRISALAWDMLDISLVLLEEAHELCRAGDLARARRHYESVYAAGAVMLDFPSLAFSSDAELPLVLTMRVYADAAAAAGLLYLRDVDYLKAHAAGKHARYLLDYMTDSNASTKSLAKLAVATLRPVERRRHPSGTSTSL